MLGWWIDMVSPELSGGNSFPHGVDRPDPVDANEASPYTDLYKHFNATEVTVVKELQNAAGVTKGVGYPPMIIQWGQINASGVAHEIGHGLGLVAPPPMSITPWPAAAIDGSCPRNSPRQMWTTMMPDRRDA